jgi:hypothetical protein
MLVRRSDTEKKRKKEMRKECEIRFVAEAGKGKERKYQEKVPFYPL